METMLFIINWLHIFEMETMLFIINWLHIFEAFYIPFQADCLIFTAMNLFHQVMSERTKHKASHP